VKKAIKVIGICVLVLVFLFSGYLGKPMASMLLHGQVTLLRVWPYLALTIVARFVSLILLVRVIGIWLYSKVIELSVSKEAKHEYL